MLQGWGLEGWGLGLTEENTVRQGYCYTCLAIGGVFLRKTQEGCGGLRGEKPGAFPKARLIFQQPFSLPENAQTLAGIACCAAGKLVNNFPAVSKFAGKLQGRKKFKQ